MHTRSCVRHLIQLLRACTLVSKHCQYQALNCRKAMRLRVMHAATRCVASTRVRHAPCHLQATGLCFRCLHGGAQVSSCHVANL